MYVSIKIGTKYPFLSYGLKSHVLIFAIFFDEINLPKGSLSDPLIKLKVAQCDSFYLLMFLDKLIHLINILLAIADDLVLALFLLLLLKVAVAGNHHRWVLIQHSLHHRAVSRPMLVQPINFLLICLFVVRKNSRHSCRRQIHWSHSVIVLHLITRSVVQQHFSYVLVTQLDCVVERRVQVIVFFVDTNSCVKQQKTVLKLISFNSDVKRRVAKVSEGIDVDPGVIDESADDGDTWTHGSIV